MKITWARTGTTTSPARHELTPARPDPGARCRTRCGWSSRRRSCSSCRGSASTASTRRARRRARRARSTSAPRTASCSSTRTAAAAGGCASPAARTRRSTSTTAPARPRSARSASRASRSGIPTVCSETCVGRLRYIGLVLYDADRVLAAASTKNEHRPLRGAAVGVPRPARPGGDPRRPSRRGSPRDWIDAAQRSPVWALINRYEVALPLHPEYRTMPMVWYIPPLSPVVDVVRETGDDGEDAGNLFGAIDALRIPVEYLAELFTAGDPAPVHAVLRRLAAMRVVHARHQPRRASPTSPSPASVGMTGETDRRHVPAAGDRQVRRALRHPRRARRAGARRSRSWPPSAASTTRAARAWAARGRSARARAASRPIAVENFHMLQQRQTADDGRRPDAEAGSTCSTGTARAAPRACSRRRGRTARSGAGSAATAADGPCRGSQAADGRGRHRRASRAMTSGSRRGTWPSSGRSPGSSCGTRTTPCAATCRPAHGRRRPARPRRRAAGRAARPPRAHAADVLAADYVATFDLSRRHALHLTYFTHGDTRKRGLALLRFKQTYRAVRLRARRRASCPTTCRVVLEFAATRRRRGRDAAAAGAPGRARAAGLGAGRGGLAVRGGDRRRCPRHAARRCTARCARPWPGWRRRGRRARRSASTRSFLPR